LNICWVGNRFLAVGWHGFCLESADGLLWQPKPTPIPLHLTSCAEAEDLLVVVGAKASVFAAKRGQDFQQVHQGREDRGLWAVAHGNGRFLAVGMEGLALTSRDGHTWYPLDLGIRANLWGLAFAQGRFVAVGDQAILVSEDGTRFEYLSAPGILNAVAFAEGLWVAVGWGGLVLTSPDGRNWRRQTTGVWKGLFGVARGKGQWVAVGEQGTVLASPDGIYWKPAVLEGMPFLTGVAWNGTRFVASGWGLALYTSSDGILWQAAYPGTGQQLLGLASSGQSFVAVGYEGLKGLALSSTVGSTWHLTTRVPGWLLGVTWGKGRFVAVGEKGLILVSPDGHLWKMARTPTSKWLYGVTFGQDRFVAVGEVLLLSQDGLTWEALPSPTEETLLGVAYGQDAFLAAGERGSLLVSPDGYTWEKVLSGGAPWYKGVVYAQDRFVVTGYGRVLVSKRGWDWEEADTRHLPNHLPSVAYGQNRFALVGHPRPGEGVAAFSPDGLTWEEVHPLGMEPEAITYGAGHFVVAGNCGTLLTFNPR
jgi:hypothetical protein